LVYKKLVASASKTECEAMINWHKRELSIKSWAKLLSLNRLSLYYRPVGLSEDEIKLKHMIDSSYLEYFTFSSRKITAYTGCVTNMV
jgi:putative transposase